jgi:hypothetical protein
VAIAERLGSYRTVGEAVSIPFLVWYSQDKLMNDSDATCFDGERFPPLEAADVALPVGAAVPAAAAPTPASDAASRASNAWKRIGRDVLSGLQTLLSAAVYATLIVTFGFQVARVDGLSMAPTLEDHDLLIVN